MGKKEKAVKKAVLDTNVLISAILFKGELAAIVDLWKRGRLVPVVSRETFDEFRRVLEYPKFRLAEGEIKTIMEDEVLPFFEIVEITSEVSGVCKDADDDKFLSCAMAASADFIVSGDKHLCDIVTYKSVRILRVSELLRMLG